MKKIIALLFITIFPIMAAAQNAGGSVKIYLVNTAQNPNAEDCGRVVAVNRNIPKNTKAVARAALEELFKGVSEQEKAASYVSLFQANGGSFLISVNVKKGAAYVNFRKDIKEIVSNASTSCGSETFFAQIENTLKQFPTIKKVFYAIEGNPEDFYDWIQIGECPAELKNCSGKNFSKR